MQLDLGLFVILFFVIYLRSSTIPSFLFAMCSSVFKLDNCVYLLYVQAAVDSEESCRVGPTCLR